MGRERLAITGLRGEPTVAGAVDQDVPLYLKGERLFPQRERDLGFFRKVEELGVARATHFAYGISLLPPVFFPCGEYIQHLSFPERFRQKYGNLESEHSRVALMLAEHGHIRGFPKEYEPMTKDSLGSDKVLESWRRQRGQVEEAAASLYGSILEKMQKQADFIYGNHSGQANHSLPVYYQSSEASLLAERALWQRALEQAVTDFQKADWTCLEDFLALYHRVKDPITPMRVGQDQVEIFINLYQQAVAEVKPWQRNLSGDQVLITQLALESSFQALPAVVSKELITTRLVGHQELPYLNVKLTQLPRGEFASAERVVGVILKELLDDAEEYQEAMITPVTVSYLQEPEAEKPELFIIDGNNRAAAVLLIKYLAENSWSFSDSVDFSEMRSFIDSHRLDVEWEVDLVGALKVLSQHQDLQDRLVKTKEVVGVFAQGQVPALLVQEANFFTVAVNLSEETDEVVLLQPMHQAIYNCQAEYQDRRIFLAIPAKKQSHGRALGNNVRFIWPFGQSGEDLRYRIL